MKPRMLLEMADIVAEVAAGYTYEEERHRGESEARLLRAAYEVIEAARNDPEGHGNDTAIALKIYDAAGRGEEP